MNLTRPVSFFCLCLLTISAFSQETNSTKADDEKSSKSGSMRKVGEGSFRNFEIDIDEAELETSIESAVEQAMLAMEVMFEKMEIHIEPVEINLGNLDFGAEPVVINIPRFDIDIEPIEMDLDDIDIDIDIDDDGNDWEFDEDEDRSFDKDKEKLKEKDKLKDKSDKSELKEKDKAKGLKKIN